MNILNVIKAITGISTIAKIFIKNKDKSEVIEGISDNASKIGNSISKVDEIPNKKVSRIVRYVITTILALTAIAGGYFAINDPSKADKILSVSSQVVQMLNQYTGEDNGTGVPSP